MKRLIVDVGASTFGHGNGRFATRGELASDAQGTSHGLRTDEPRTKYGRTTVRGESWKLDSGLLEAAGGRNRHASVMSKISRNHRPVSCHETIHLEARVTAPSAAVTRTVAPGGYFPAMIARATGVSTSRWIARFTGRAP